MTRALQKRFDNSRGLIDKLNVLDLNDRAIIESARLFGENMRAGRRVEQNDCLIAGILKSNGCKSIATRNVSDFKRLGLRTIEY